MPILPSRPPSANSCRCSRLALVHPGRLNTLATRQAGWYHSICMGAVAVSIAARAGVTLGADGLVAQGADWPCAGDEFFRKTAQSAHLSWADPKAGEAACASLMISQLLDE